MTKILVRVLRTAGTDLGCVTYPNVSSRREDIFHHLPLLGNFYKQAVKPSNLANKESGVCIAEFSHTILEVDVVVCILNFSKLLRA